MRSLAAALLLIGAATLAPVPAPAQDPTPAEDPEEAPVPPAAFTDEFLADATNIDAGGVIWEDQCRHCHGRSAYPGKAPKLRPNRYTADFVYDRVSNGFRRMPPWRDVYTDLERMQIVSYILSDSFSP